MKRKKVVKIEAIPFPILKRDIQLYCQFLHMSYNFMSLLYGFIIFYMNLYPFFFSFLLRCLHKVIRINACWRLLPRKQTIDRKRQRHLSIITTHKKSNDIDFVNEPWKNRKIDRKWHTSSTESQTDKWHGRMCSDIEKMQ